jgi:uncharacterized glyoxalase superfamily protein PhnB
MQRDDLDAHELHGVQPVLRVADVSAAITFYRDVLGFEVDFIAGDPPVHARVSSGDRERGYAVRLRLIPRGDDAAEQGRSYDWIHVGSDLDGLFEKYRAAGVEIVSAPIDQPWGLREFRIHDLDGHLHCFVAEIAEPSTR